MTLSLKRASKQCCYPHWKVREFDVGWKVVTVFAVQTDFLCTDKCVKCWKDGIITLLPMYIIMPHGSATYIDAACCYRLSSVVWQSVCHNSEPCKNWFNRSRCRLVVDSGGPKEPCIRWGPDPLMGMGNFEGEGAAIVKYGDTLQWAEPNMPFGLWARMGLMHHVFNGVQIPHRKGYLDPIDYMGQFLGGGPL